MCDLLLDFAADFSLMNYKKQTPLQVGGSCKGMSSY